MLTRDGVLLAVEAPPAGPRRGARSEGPVDPLGILVGPSRELLEAQVADDQVMGFMRDRRGRWSDLPRSGGRPVRGRAESPTPRPERG